MAERTRQVTKRFIEAVDEDIPHFLIFFVDEKKYSIVKRGHGCLPKDFDGNVPLNSTIQIKHKGEGFNGIFIAAGKSLYNQKLTM